MASLFSSTLSFFKTRCNTKRKESGLAMVMFAILLPALLMIAGLMLSFASIYLNASRMQNAADAAALAGSIYLPDDPTKANTASREVAARNLTDTIVTSHKGTVQTVAITRVVDGIFLMPDLTITRTANAQYRPYVPMGSPTNCLGCGGSEHYYLNISAAGTEKSTGDRYNSEGVTNLDYQEHQEYVLRVNTSGNHKLEVYDPAFTQQGDNCTIKGCTGDHQPDPSKAKPPTTFQLKDPEGNLIVSRTFQPNDSSSYLKYVTLANRYMTAGDYTILVSNSTSTQYNGLNRFSLRSSTGTSLFAKGKLVIYAKDQDADTTFYVARVNKAYAGTELHIDLFDIGDAAGGANLRILPPTDSNVNSFSCRDSSTCTYNGLTAATQNGKTKKIVANIPDNYTCNSTSTNGCWIRLKIEYPGQVNDTTSWNVYAGGTPNRLLDEK